MRAAEIHCNDSCNNISYWAAAPAHHSSCSARTCVCALSLSLSLPLSIPLSLILSLILSLSLSLSLSLTHTHTHILLCPISCRHVCTGEQPPLLHQVPLLEAAPLLLSLEDVVPLASLLVPVGQVKRQLQQVCAAAPLTMQGGGPLQCATCSAMHHSGNLKLGWFVLRHSGNLYGCAR
jgi:hypothetical protein